MRPIYLDNLATTPLDPRVLEAMTPYLKDQYGNPHSRLHQFSRDAHDAVEAARTQVARLVSAKPDEVVFTSGATESNNLAILGSFTETTLDAAHAATCVTEHPSVLEPFRYLERSGVRVTWLGVNRDGMIDLAELAASLVPETKLVSIMAANNETGVCHPMAEIAAVCAEESVMLHCDATQTAGKIPVDDWAGQVDFLSLSAHKLYGPGGVGALVVRDGRSLAPRQFGGGQEAGLRSGTTPVPLCVGFGAACEIAAECLDAESARIAVLRDQLLDRLNVGIGDIKVNGAGARTLPGCLNLTLPGVDAEDLLMRLPELALSTGSACSTMRSGPSHVLRAIGLGEMEIHGSIRIGLGRFSTNDEIMTAGRVITDRVRTDDRTVESSAR